MRFPSLFRIPKHQQFEIKPRYYDPVKEYVEEREALAKRGKGENQSGSRIRFDRKKHSKGLNTSLLQMIIALILTALLVGWLYLGDDVAYVFFLLAPVYLYFRFRRR